MTTITSQGVPTNTQPVQQTSSASDSTLTSDYETFLQMLTVQMTNQDPLNPVDSSDYAVQLATFSSVEQQVLTNELLQDLTDSLVSSGLEAFSSWVGKSVKSASPKTFASEPVQFEVPQVTGADRAVVTVYDELGDAVYSAPVDPSESLQVWTGETFSGSMASQGAYTFLVDSFIGEDLIATNTAETYSVVSEARINAGQVSLVLDSGREVSPNAVSAIRD